MKLLESFIKNSQDKRKIQRATTVKILLCGYKHEEIMPILGVSSGFISTWKKAFFKNGVDGFKLGYKCNKRLLNETQRQQVINLPRYFF